MPATPLTAAHTTVRAPARAPRSMRLPCFAFRCVRARRRRVAGCVTRRALLRAPRRSGAAAALTRRRADPAAGHPAADPADAVAAAMVAGGSGSGDGDADGAAPALPKEVAQPVWLLAFNRFAAERRRELRAENENRSGVDAERLIGIQWRSMSTVRARSHALTPARAVSCALHFVSVRAALRRASSRAIARVKQEAKQVYMQRAEEERQRIVASQFGTSVAHESHACVSSAADGTLFLRRR